MDSNPVKSVSFHAAGTKVTIEFSPRRLSFTAKEAQALSYKVQDFMQQEIVKMAPDAFPRRSWEKKEERPAGWKENRAAELRAAINGG